MVMVVKMEERKKEDKLQAVWFAAGVAALMACLERAILVSFVEQWRLIAFLALNLLLLAILFTSTSTTPTNPIVESSNNTTTTESKIEVKVRKECKKYVVPCVEDISEVAITKDVKEEYPKITDNKENKEEQLLDDSIDEAQQISMEELNERAEAFIAMFRQHLISDAKAYSYSKSCRIRTSISLNGGDKIFPKRRPIY
ncbi:hypothetical protein H5410_009533 [Solanum commersonii]|uniref:Uncharacterized protein n=1 Tax=Solanum commersonii TaxID=4109 RepID=A0A9J6AJ07_SOLCO|nr:hypothetical protein H5410_009533 [Solanum commersonii]